MKPIAFIKNYSFKAFLFFAVIFLCSGIADKCDAQAIIGKWKIISTTILFTPEGAAKQGQQSRVSPVAGSVSIIAEFKGDHTYIKTSTEKNNPKINILEGTWNLTGDQLTIIIDPKYNPEKGHESMTQNLLITGNSMSVTQNETNNKMVSKVIVNFQRI
jgi:hypothetical protein